MTAKHYNAIAHIIDLYRGYSSKGDIVLLLIAQNMADYFAQDNPKFNRSRFLTACGITECNQ